MMRKRLSQKQILALAEKFLQTLIVPHPKSPEPLTIALIGPIGSGKTTVAKYIAQKRGLARIGSDDVRVFLRRMKKYRESLVRPISWLSAQFFWGQGVGVIFDKDFVHPEERKRVLALSKYFGIPVYFIKVTAPEKLIIRRLRKKKYYAKTDVFRNANEALIAYFGRRRFHQKNKIKVFATIDTSKNWKPKIEAVLRRIEKGLKVS